VTGSPGAPDPDPVLRDTEEHWPVVAGPRRSRGVFLRLRTDLVRMPDGEVAERDVIEHPGAVAVVALDEAGQVLMIRQYRHPAGQLLWEIPAGLRDVPGEEPRVTAERELLEETGYRARDWHVLADVFNSPGMSDERVLVFLARGLSWVPEAERAGYVPRHEEAHLQLRWVPLTDVVSHFLAGDLHNGITAVGVFAAHAARQGGFAALREAVLPQR
jgi:ADP-ribose pyrophosphatase